MAPISGNYNFRDPSMYMNHAKNFTTAYIKGGSQGIGNYLNGQIDSTMTNTVSGVADNLMGDNVNPYVKMAVKSALTILMSWVKGQDKKEADNAKTEGNALSNQMQGVAQDGEGATNEMLTNAEGEIGTQTQIIGDTKNDIDERNEQNTKIEEENEEKQAEIDKAIERQNEILAELKNLGYTGAENTDEADGADSTDKKGENPANLSSDSITDEAQIKLIKEYNELGIQITNKQTLITSNKEHITSNIEANDEAYSNNIESAGQNIESLYNQYAGAMQNVQDLISGKQKMFTPEMIMKAAEQMAMSAINGTEGGVLAAAATAMGASSIFSFGSTAAEAAKYAEASGDKFSSIAPRVLASAGIKIAQATAQSYVQQALSNISQIAGVNLNEIYNEGMEIYHNAAAENPNKEDLADNSDTKENKPEEDKPKTDKA